MKSKANHNHQHRPPRTPAQPVNRKLAAREENPRNCGMTLRRTPAERHPLLAEKSQLTDGIPRSPPDQKRPRGRRKFPGMPLSTDFIRSIFWFRMDTRVSASTTNTI